ncbi:transcription factor E2F6-like [Erinaceus europaeus]|uniref:Transcription factor E2F6-like n=1 Tax=Erinaceus europaeus TaxID=9365 RepID=A0ABM3WSF1_ERIEU|nr:transcription factor E2F6-like [Erinaceus europaeus]
MSHVTQKLMDLFRSAPRGILDIKKVATQLGVGKRRVQDVINIFSEMGLIERRSNNRARWIGFDLSNQDEGPQQKKLKEDILQFQMTEEALDELIKDSAQQLLELANDKENQRLAYLTIQDLNAIPVFQEQNVLIVKAPEETKLEVPTPGFDSIQVYIKSTKGPIDVYLCEREDHMANNMPHAGETSTSESKRPEELDKE